MKKKFALLICVLFSYNTVWAQAPTIDDMHKALEYAAQETNRQLSNEAPRRKRRGIECPNSQMQNIHTARFASPLNTAPRGGEFTHLD